MSLPASVQEWCHMCLEICIAERALSQTSDLVQRASPCRAVTSQISTHTSMMVAAPKLLFVEVRREGITARVPLPGNALIKACSPRSAIKQI